MPESDGPRSLGLRAHIGWADAITLERARGVPVFVDRRSVNLRPTDGPAFPFHAAMEAPAEDRAAIIAEGMAAAESSATAALVELAEELEIEAIGVVVGRGVLRIPLDRIIASSQLFHTAEAEVYQRAIAAAAANLALPLATLEFSAAEAHPEWAAVTAMRAQAGVPWRKDHKFAAIAAWEALATVL